MSFPRYEKYKDSGVEWLGEVPEEWEVVPIKLIGRLKGGAGFPHGEQGVEGEELSFHKVNALGQANGDGVLLPSENTISRETASRLGAFIFPPKAIVFAKVGAALLLGRIRTISEAACLDNNMMGLVVNEESHVVNFIRYAMDLVRFDLIANPGAVPSLNEAQIGNFHLVIPQKTEQRTIAAFLDHETGKIDALVAEQEKLIGLLKEKRQAVISHTVTKGLDPNARMKDSGVEWLGEVPEGWEVVRLGNLFFEANESGNDNLPILQVSIHHGVSDKELDESEMDRKVARSEDRSKYKRVQPGDLAYNMMRAWQGGFGTVTVPGQISPAYIVARPQKHIVTEFVEHVLRTPRAVEEMRRFSRGVTDFRLRLYWDEFKNIRIAVPPLEEAEKICGHIHRITVRFDSLRNSSEQSIALLQERRTALISAAVAGKIDVRGYEAARTEAQEAV